MKRESETKKTMTDHHGQWNFHKVHVVIFICCVCVCVCVSGISASSNDDTENQHTYKCACRCFCCLLSVLGKRFGIISVYRRI